MITAPPFIAALARWRPAFVACVAGFVAAAPCRADDVVVHVDKQGERVIVDVSARCAAPLAETWAVFTDYEHMASFVPNLKASTVLQREGQRLQVEQAGEAKVGFFRLSVASVRQVDLTPMREIKSRLVRGDFKFYDATTRLSEDGGETVIAQHSEYAPTGWVPPMVGPSMIASETKRHYASLIAEVQRRHAAGTAAAAPARAASADR